MFIIEIIKNISEKFSFLPETLVILGAIAACFQKGRAYFKVFFKFAWLYLSFPIKFGRSIESVLVDIQTLKSDSTIQSNEIKIVKELIGYNGGSGLLDVVGYVVGFQSNEFWLKEQPGIFLSKDGELLDSTHAFCRLLGMSDKDSVMKGNWQSFLDKKEARDFIKEYADVASRRETFRRQISLTNVFGDNAGSWIFIAMPISSEKAKAIRYMAMLYPYGENAKATCKVHGWPEKPPL